jgi:adenylate cyclase
LQDRLAERAAGNPLFVEEAVRALAASGALEGTPHAYRLRGAATPSLPHGIDEVLASRIASLAARDKAVLQAAAVIGRGFPVALLTRITGLESDAIAAALESLERSELVSASDAGDEPARHFCHPLQQRVAYGSLAPDVRAELHRRIASELTRPHGTRGNPHAGRIAVHCEAAGDLLDAARWHRRAAIQIVGWDPAQSYVHWRCVLSCSARLEGDDAARLRLSACEAVVRLGFHQGLAPDEAEALAREGHAIARRLGDVRMHALLSSAVGCLRGSTGDVDAGIAHQRTALVHAERSGAAGLALMTGAQLVFSHRVAGCTVEGLRLADALLDRHRPDDVRSLGADFVWLRQLELARAMLLVDRGRLDQGGAELTRVLALLRDEDAPVAYAWALSLTAAVVRFAGDPSAVLAARIEEAYERARLCAVPSLVGRALSSLATLRLCQKRWGEARAFAERADATMRELGHTFYVDFDPRLILSYARFGLGDIAGARAAAYEALQHAFRTGARLGQIDTMAALARLLVRYGTLEQIGEGRRLLRHGLALVRRCRARSREPFFWLELAGLERRAGNEGRALAAERRGVRQLRAMNAYGHLPRPAVTHALPPEHTAPGDRASR